MADEIVVFFSTDPGEIAPCHWSSFSFPFSLFYIYIYIFFVVQCKDSRRNASVKMRLFIYLFISVFSFTKKDSFVCVPCFYDAGRFVVRSCVRSCIFFLFFLFFWAVFLLHRVKKKRTTTPPSFFFFCFLFLRAQWIKWIIVASCECVQTQHTQLKTLGHFKKEKRNSIQKRTRIPERFHLKNISVCVWCPTLFDVQSLFHQMASWC